MDTLHSLTSTARHSCYGVARTTDGAAVLLFSTVDCPSGPLPCADADAAVAALEHTRFNSPSITLTSRGLSFLLAAAAVSPTQVAVHLRGMSPVLVAVVAPDMAEELATALVAAYERRREERRLETAQRIAASRRLLENRRTELAQRLAQRQATVAEARRNALARRRAAAAPHVSVDGGPEEDSELINENYR